MCAFHLIFELVCVAVASVEDAKKDVLVALSQIIDPDFGTDIVSCGFVKDLEISEALEEVKLKDTCWWSLDALLEHLAYFGLHLALLFQVSFRLELTTPACPIKDMVSTVPVLTCSVISVELFTLYLQLSQTK